MKTKAAGILSAITASLCCLVPIVLIMLGLGSLGIGAAIGKYHWYFIIAAGFLLAFAWSSYFKEKKSCELRACEMKNKGVTKGVLLTATVLVLLFTGLNVYTYSFNGAKELTSNLGTRVSIPVEGMTCASCEIAVNSSLRKLPGIYEARASAKRKSALVAYDPAAVSLDEIISTINKTGYTATKPEV